MQFIKNVDSVAGGSIFVLLDTDDRDGQGSVKFYDARYTGDAPRGSQDSRLGFTVDGQFISELSPDDFAGDAVEMLDLQGDIPSWKIPLGQRRELHAWLHACYVAIDRDYPQPWEWGNTDAGTGHGDYEYGRGHL